MSYSLGIDIGGTFTDIMCVSDKGQTIEHKILSTPHDPSLGFINGLMELAELVNKPFGDFVSEIETIVHGTTVATNALLTSGGAKTALITTQGLRDALEMRRGIREEQYNNNYRNVTPLVPRYLRLTVNERINSKGKILKKLSKRDMDSVIKKIKTENVNSVAVCFMNSYRNPIHEKQAVKYLREKLRDILFFPSFEVLPSIRFYERISTTVVSAYVGPIVRKYLDNLIHKLKNIKFGGKLLIMQSNGGVVMPEQVKKNPAVTVLSGPAAGPTAGAFYSSLLGYKNCITVDMGGTSFDASLVINNHCITSTEGAINRYRISLPSLDIITIGAGGGSIGWLNEGRLLQMGPQSAGALPGPACYNLGGKNPTCTDADLVLGYLNPDFFAGGKIKLDVKKAESAIKEELSQKLSLSVLETAAGMSRVINNNMAQGVRQVSVERGYDPREFLFIVAGGAGPIHAAEICKELEIPLFLVPDVSSVFCAAGMLLGDLKHDFVCSCISQFSKLNRKKFITFFNDMKDEGVKILSEEGMNIHSINYLPVLDVRYTGQYHEVPLEITWEDVVNYNLASITETFHKEHNRLYGYSLKNEKTEIELINVRLRVIGKTRKPEFLHEGMGLADPENAIKEYRKVFIPEIKEMKSVPVYDGDKNLHGALIKGPCVIEKITTSVFLSESYDCQIDNFGSFIVYDKAKYPDGFKKAFNKQIMSKQMAYN